MSLEYQSFMADLALNEPIIPANWQTTILIKNLPSSNAVPISFAPLASIATSLITVLDIQSLIGGGI
jgi:hypothetical protein